MSLFDVQGLTEAHYLTGSENKFFTWFKKQKERLQADKRGMKPSIFSMRVHCCVTSLSTEHSENHNKWSSEAQEVRGVTVQP